MPAGLPDAVVQGLARRHDPRRQVVQDGGVLDALDRALDRRPAAECREVVRIAFILEELAPAPQGALCLAVPARIPPAELDHRLLGKELFLRPLQQRVALLPAGVEPPDELARLAVRADKRFALLQHPGKRRGHSLPDLPLMVSDAVEQRVVARRMEGVESLPLQRRPHAPPSPASTSPKHRGPETHGRARRRCPRFPRPWGSRSARGRGTLSRRLGSPPPRAPHRARPAATPPSPAPASWRGGPVPPGTLGFGSIPPPSPGDCRAPSGEVPASRADAQPASPAPRCDRRAPRFRARGSEWMWPAPDGTKCSCQSR